MCHGRMRDVDLNGMWQLTDTLRMDEQPAMPVSMTIEITVTDEDGPAIDIDRAATASGTDCSSTIHGPHVEPSTTE